MKLVSLQLGSVRELASQATGQWWDQDWRTALYKQPCAGPQWLGPEGFAGDAQADRKNHGGPDKAVCVYPAEHYAHWKHTLELADLPWGAFGENLTTEGLLETAVCIGDIFELGAVRVQISQPRQPCWKIARRWRIKDLPQHLEMTGFTGWYFRVLQTGQVETGAGFSLVHRPHPEWTVEGANQIMHHRKDDLPSARLLAQCPALSASWVGSLNRRAQAGTVED
jgi:MOSC domain-containing protein YiiM